MVARASRPKLVEPSQEEIDEQLFRLRNGLNIQHGFLYTPSLAQPIQKYADDTLKDIHAEAEARTKENEKYADEAVDVADILAPIESIARAPRQSQTASDETTRSQSTQVDGDQAPGKTKKSGDS